MIIDGENEGLNECNMKIIIPNEINEMERNIQRKIWRGRNKKSICWDFYYVNDDKGVDLGNP
jgi:hypothetical protein